uniref:F-box protein 40, tandem duplicate 1 n=1 Tax=Sinocyclocheilus anshuiensis TaxID=1608454 RepID=A0A671RKI8_9TELE
TREQLQSLHRHCESCHSRRCKTPIEICVSCAIMKEHMLLCPNERVPCLNVEYGCLFTMCRSSLAKHLTVCPASVVSCSMEWNRWPIEESETPEFYENILKENYTQEPLDLSMALRDQQHLFHSLKMKTLFPELIVKSSQVTFIYIALLTIQIVSKQLYRQRYQSCPFTTPCYSTVGLLQTETILYLLHRCFLSAQFLSGLCCSDEHERYMSGALTWAVKSMTCQNGMKFKQLVCSLERELRGHLIAESGSTDALLLDVGTQTYDFNSAPFKAEASLADITADRALKLHVHIQVESVTRRHNKSSFLRQWMVSAQLSQRSTVFYDKELSTFCLRPEVSDKLYEGIKPVTVERKRACNTDALSRLPFEVLVHIAGFLDSFTLSQLALVSRLMREVCRTLLHDRGMVSLKWEKKVYSHGGWCWRARKRFSNLFSTVDSWCFDKLPPISEHLKVCPYYQRENKTAPVPLTGVHESHEKEAHRNQSLVSMFMKNK